MATKTLVATGLRCPQPVLKIAAMMPEINPGDLLEVSADCPTFEDDVRKWCKRMNKTLLSFRSEGTTMIAQIQF